MKFAKFQETLISINSVAFISIFTAVGLVWMFAYNNIIKLFMIPDIQLFGVPPSVENYGEVSMVMIGILIAPLVETLLFQTLVYFVLSRINLFNQRKILIIIVSAILFAVEHIYSVQYMIYTFVMGAFLMYAYIISKGKNPFLRVFLIHLMINSIAFLLDILTD